MKKEAMITIVNALLVENLDKTKQFIKKGLIGNKMMIIIEQTPKARSLAKAILDPYQLVNLIDKKDLTADNIKNIIEEEELDSITIITTKNNPKDIMEKIQNKLQIDNLIYNINPN